MKKENVKPEYIYEIVGQYLKNVEGINEIVIKDSILKSVNEDKITVRIKNMINIQKHQKFFLLLLMAIYIVLHTAPLMVSI